VAGARGVTDFRKTGIKAEAKFYLLAKEGKGQMP
jgi:hypothetical protein